LIDKVDLVTIEKSTEEFIEWLLEKIVTSLFIHCNTAGDVPQRGEM
jgi:hypothetical protein